MWWLPMHTHTAKEHSTAVSLFSTEVLLVPPSHPHFLKQGSLCLGLGPLLLFVNGNFPYLDCFIVALLPPGGRGGDVTIPFSSAFCQEAVLKESLMYLELGNTVKTQRSHTGCDLRVTRPVLTPRAMVCSVLWSGCSALQPSAFSVSVFMNVVKLELGSVRGGAAQRSVT